MLRKVATRALVLMLLAALPLGALAVLAHDAPDVPATPIQVPPRPQQPAFYGCLTAPLPAKEKPAPLRVKETPAALPGSERPPVEGRRGQPPTTVTRRELGGRASSWTGAPLAATVVALRLTEEPARYSTRSGAEGLFAFEGLEPAPYRVSVLDARGFEIARADMELGLAGAWVELRGEEPARIDLRVTAAEGIELPSSLILVNRASGATFTVALLDGGLSVELPPGVYGALPTEAQHFEIEFAPYGFLANAGDARTVALGAKKLVLDELYVKGIED
jgi:hypothetical protein